MGLLVGSSSCGILSTKELERCRRQYEDDITYAKNELQKSLYNCSFVRENEDYCKAAVQAYYQTRVYSANNSYRLCTGFEK